MSENMLLNKLEKCRKQDSVIFMIETFPYFIVGPIVFVTKDYVGVKAKFGTSDELLGTIFLINISTIVAFG